MFIDEFGQKVHTTDDICDLLYLNPELDLKHFLVEDAEQYNASVQSNHVDFEYIKKYIRPEISVEDFDSQHQSQWFMPDEYKNFDIAKWVLDQCTSEAELQRAAEELLLFQQKNLFTLLCYLKYLVDTMRSNNIVWGVGRGSSTASYVLYLIGAHRINSLYYNIPITDFLK
jgi:DNA polymerase III alpha subunit